MIEFLKVYMEPCTYAGLNIWAFGVMMNLMLYNKSAFWRSLPLYLPLQIFFFVSILYAQSPEAGLGVKVAKETAPILSKVFENCGEEDCETEVYGEVIQGNMTLGRGSFVDIKLGMAKSQVYEILGAPDIEDPFEIALSYYISRLDGGVIICKHRPFSSQQGDVLRILRLRYDELGKVEAVRYREIFDGAVIYEMERGTAKGLSRGIVASS